MSKTFTEAQEIMKAYDTLRKAKEYAQIISEKVTFKFGENKINLTNPSEINSDTKEYLSNSDMTWSVISTSLSFESELYKVVCNEEGIYNFLMEEEDDSLGIKLFEAFISRLQE